METESIHENGKEEELPLESTEASTIAASETSTADGVKSDRVCELGMDCESSISLRLGSPASNARGDRSIFCDISIFRCSQATL